MLRREFLASVSAFQIAGLRPMTKGVVVISHAEREARIEKARRLMAASQIEAIVLEAGSSLSYFTGAQWGRSERLFGFVLPARGEPGWVVPAFEEMRAREIIRFGKDIRTWEEDESPFKAVANILRDRGVTAARVGIEESVRFFIVDGIRREAPKLELVSADPVTVGCRMIKSGAELALMESANRIAVEAFRASVPTLKEGMTHHAFRANCEAAFQALGVAGDVTVNFGRYSAFPHGSTQPQSLREGDVVLMDGVCSVEGYCGDITRTIVYGKPNARQRQIWDLERKAQDAALAAARPGATCESVDAAARKVIVDAGLGPGYKVPGLPHRTGHGIGLDVHESPHLVKGNTMRLQAGMCFSNEPMITSYSEFGIRLEDCMHITEDGVKLFTTQSPSLDRPFG